MFERKVVIVQIVIFLFLLLVIFGTLSLTESNILEKKYIPYIFFFSMLGSAVTGWVIIGKYHRNKIFRPHIEFELSKLGYELISERPPNFDEILNNIHVVPTILINGTPIQNYMHISKNERILQVRGLDNEEFELRVFITKTWNREYKLEIVKETKLT